MPSSPNQLLSSLSTRDFDLLAPHLKSVTLGMRKSLEKPNRRIDAVHFPESGFASVVAIQSGGKQVEVGLIGREGMTGLPIVLGNHRSPHATYIQAAGNGKCIPSAELRKATRTSQSLRDSLLKYVQAFNVQTTHTAICNAQSRMDRRLARWLLMAHDRIGEDTLTLTHEFLSLMLAVRRAGVTDALNALRVHRSIDPKTNCILEMTSPITCVPSPHRSL
jgi:CRP-like cAMP-binding protein